MSTAGGKGARAARASSPVRAFASRMLAKLSTKRITSLLFGVAVLGTAAFGGLNTVEKPPLPEYEVGDTIELALMTITITEVSVVPLSEDEATLAGLDEGSLLQLRGTFTNKTSVSLALADGAPGLPDSLVSEYAESSEMVPDFGTKKLRPVSMRVDDDTSAVALAPRIPVEAIIHWPMPNEALADGTVSIGLWDRELTHGSFIASEETLYISGGALAGTLTITGLEPAPTPEESPL